METCYIKACNANHWVKRDNLVLRKMVNLIGKLNLISFWVPKQFNLKSLILKGVLQFQNTILKDLLP